MNQRKILAALLILCTVVFISCKSALERKTEKRELSLRKSAMLIQGEIEKTLKAQEDSVKAFVKSLPVEQKISQLFLVNIAGNEKYHPVEYSGALKGQGGKGNFLVPGGCLYFSYNIAESSEKMIQFNDSVRNFCINHNIVPPFLAVDQEGGFVNRLRSLTGPLPSNKRVAECLTVENACRLYYLQGIQMKALGFHLNLAPVVEVLNSSNSSFLGDRSFGQLEQVLSFGTACINGFENSGIGTVLKHFPGNSNTDPHTGLPEILWDEETLQKNVLIPFERLSSLNPSGILMSHARLALSDSKTPACLSEYWVSQVLRNKMEFDGLIFSDDIFMDALQKNGFPPEKAAIMAINAGIDCIMLSEKRFAPVAKILLEEGEKSVEFAEKLNSSVEKIIKWKISRGILKFYLNDDSSWSVIPAEPEPIEARIQDFLPALSENIDLYRKYFMP